MRMVCVARPHWRFDATSVLEYDGLYVLVTLTDGLVQRNAWVSRRDLVIEPDPFAGLLDIPRNHAELVADALAHGDVPAALAAFEDYRQADPDGARLLKLALLDLLREMT